MNPLVQPDPGLFIWTILTFLALLTLLTKFAWRPLLAALEARQAAISAPSTPAAQAGADTAVTGALRQLFALSEAHPDLKANQNFLGLQQELTGTEERVALSRQAYNDSVMQLNTRIQTFPTVLIAGMFGFKEEPFFETPAEQKEAPTVQF